jgi:apolipoprotein N-acyltransferase
MSILANKITFQKITPLIGWEKIHGYWTRRTVTMAFLWNVSNNIIYLKSIQEEKLPNEIEVPP